MCKLGKKSYGSGYLAGMKLGDMPLVEYTRDRLHREVLRRFGPDTLPESYELTTTYTPGGQLEQQHLNHPQLNREYGYDEGGQAGAHQRAAADEGVPLQRQRASDGSPHHPSRPGHHPAVRHGPGGEPAAGPGVLPREQQQGMGG